MNAIDLLRYFVGLEDSQAEHDHNEHREMIDQARGLIAEADAHASTLKYGRLPWGVIMFEGQRICYEVVGTGTQGHEYGETFINKYEARIHGHASLLEMTDELHKAITADVQKEGCKT